MRQNIILLLASLMFLFVLGETVGRIYQNISRQIPLFANLYTYTNDSLGWKSKIISVGPTSGNYKIMVLGDSFSDGLGVAEESMWYSHLSKALNSQVAVFAGMGYGTLQEYMLIDRYFDEIKPDLIILQVCSNDLINNSLTLEKKSFHQNVLHTRPYFIKKQIKYRFPATFGFLGQKFSPNSRVIFYLGRQLQIFLAYLSTKGWLPSIETRIAQQGMKLRALRKAISTTNDIIKKINWRIGKTPLFAFIVDTPQPNSKLLKNVFTENGIQFTERVAEEIKKAQNAGQNMTLADRVHWSDAGHALAAEVLLKEYNFSAAIAIDKTL